MSRVGEIDNEMKRYLDAQMNDPGPLNQQQGMQCALRQIGKEEEYKKKPRPIYTSPKQNL